MRSVTFHVTGIPQPKGSTRAFVPKSWAAQAAAAGTTARAIVTSDNPEAKGWQQLVAEQAQLACDGVWFEGAVTVSLLFTLPRPKSLPRKVSQHLRKPDVDKLARLVLDGLTGILIADDAHVVELLARKAYAPTGSAPGLDVLVEERETTPPSRVAASSLLEGL